MTVTPNDWRISLDAVADTFRRQLVKKGFTDDGHLLYGQVEWIHDKVRGSADISVETTDKFPFMPPKVRIIRSDVEPTFHIEHNDGSPLCLWTSEIVIDDAPWQDADAFLDKVAGWFLATACGWPDDNDADLERYLPSGDTKLIVYDATKLGTGKYYRTKEKTSSIVVEDELPWPPNLSRQKNRGIRRRERNLCYVVDIDIIDNPIKSWPDLMLSTNQDLTNLQRLVEMGSVRYVLIQYKRGQTPSNLVISFDNNGRLVSCENADTSNKTRTIRGGKQLPNYAKKRVVLVGCGAIGSNIAEQLYRAGVLMMTLVDPETLRPGNVIRHLCGDEYVGKAKVIAVREKLASLGLDASKIRLDGGRVNDPAKVIELVKDHDLIIDATADMRATSILQYCCEILDIKFISVCLQREGGLARVDRYPLWGGENHLAEAQPLTTTTPAIEYGCGSPISLTPPLSVIKAAALGTQVALDELRMYQLLPATLIEVIEPQPDAPYDKIGIISS